MSDCKWFEIIVTFVLGLFGNVATAYFAVKVFEARQADRNHSLSSLSKLHQSLFEVISFFEHAKDAYEENSNPHQIFDFNSDGTDDFRKLSNDLQFWAFKSAEKFRPMYDSLADKLAAYYIFISEGQVDLDEYLSTAVEETKRLRKTIEDEIVAK